MKGGDDFVKTPELIFLTELDAHLLGLEVDNSWSVSVDTVSYYTELIESDYMGILEEQYAKSWEQISKEFPDISDHLLGVSGTNETWDAIVKGKKPYFDIVVKRLRKTVGK